MLSSCYLSSAILRNLQVACLRFFLVFLRRKGAAMLLGNTILYFYFWIMFFIDGEGKYNPSLVIENWFEIKDWKDRSSKCKFIYFLWAFLTFYWIVNLYLISCYFLINFYGIFSLVMILESLTCFTIVFAHLVRWVKLKDHYYLNPRKLQTYSSILEITSKDL